MLFRSTEEIKAALGTVHQTLDFATLESFVPQCELVHLQPYVGDALLQELEAALDDTPTPVQLALINHLRRSLAFYVVLEAAPMLAVSFSDLGLMEQNADRATPARQWVYNNFVDSAAGNADTLLDTALFWLEAKQSEFPTWQNSQAYTASRELFFHSAHELSKFVSIGQSRRTFLALRPFLRRVEELEIQPLLGAERFDELKARILMPDTLTADDKALWVAIKPVLAHWAMAEALPELAVQVTGTGVRVLADNDGIREHKAASAEVMDGLVRKARGLAEKYLPVLQRLLDAQLPVEEPRARGVIDNTGSKCFRV